MGQEGIAGVVGTSNLTDFLRSHSEGRVEAVGRPVFVGRTQQLWTVEITRATDGKLVSRGQVRFQNLQALPADR
jgi:acyl-coenzyme A thioesterase PaaI-like protein